MSEHSGQGRRRRTSKVTVPEIAETALAMIDEHGLEALTMRGLADAIGVTPMTLYRYLDNKDMILAQVAELLWRELPPIDPAITDWREQLAAMWQQLFDLMLRHPQAVPLIARGGAYSATAGSDTVGMVGVLKEAGFPPELASAFVHAASALVVGYAFAHLWQHQACAGQATHVAAGTAPAVPPDLLDYAGRIGPFTTDEFQATLRLLIDGFAARVPGPPKTS